MARWHGGRQGYRAASRKVAISRGNMFLRSEIRPVYIAAFARIIALKRQLVDRRRAEEPTHLSSSDPWLSRGGERSDEH